MDEKLAEIFHDLFGVAQDRYGDHLAMNTVEEWDSVNHLTLVLSLENAFGVSFSPDEIPGLTSIGQIRAALGRHGVNSGH
jgi:acyl carrier protein